MRLFVAALAFALAAALAGAAVVDVVSPARATAGHGKVIDLGTVGPGQTVEIAIANDTHEITMSNSTSSLSNADWDGLRVLRHELPEGWMGEDSRKYENPLKAHVIISKQAADGDYVVGLVALDEYEEVAPVEFKARVTVSRNVFMMGVVREPVKAEPREQVSYVLELENTGSASDAFTVSMSGLTRELDASKNVFVPHNSKALVEFSFPAPEVGDYAPVFEARSQSSVELKAAASARLFVGTSFVSDAKAAARGVLLFPTPQGIAYALAALLAALLA
ncbi:MAG: hypothetical protein AABW54_01695 [Candidatus Micrarchaeota archaeon]